MPQVTPVGRDSSFLDTHETNVGPRGELAPYVAECRAAESSFRHSGWRNMRARIRASLGRENAGSNRLRRWDDCGNFAWVVRDRKNEHRHAIQAAYCRDRFCVPCSRARALTVANNVSEHARKRTVRFLTLTQYSTTESLTELLDLLYKRFRALRATREWRQRVQGGVSFLEVKWRPELARWNVHLHTLIEGRYFDQAILKRLWHRVTGNSYIVDIRALNPGQMAINYVTKYATKTIDAQTTHYPAQLDEAVRALAGRRTSTTFGHWRGLGLSKRESNGDWVSVMRLTDLIHLADQGDEYATTVLNNLSRHPREPINPDGHPPPRPQVSPEYARRASVYTHARTEPVPETRKTPKHVQIDPGLFEDRDPRF